MLMDLTAIDRLPETLKNKISLQNIAAGETLFAQGDRTSAFYVVTSGIVKLIRYLDDGKICTFEIVRTNQALAEIALFAEIYPCTAIAEIDSKVISYPKDELLETLQLDPAMSRDFMEMLVEKIESLKFRLELRDIRVADKRVIYYLRHLVDYPTENTVVLDRPLKDIASDLGFTPETLSRALIKLETDGLISRSDRVIVLQNSSLT